MNVREIVNIYLKASGFDGLYSDYGACGCRIDDLMPCDERVTGCIPGYHIECTPETCEHGGGCEYHIGPKAADTRKEAT